MHIFLSPHLDDAVLSCGGTIHQLVRHGEPVRVITVMAGAIPSPLPESEIINDLHERWQIGSDPVAIRLEEDRRALSQLGVTEIIHLDIPDCIYRTHSQVTLYATQESIFAQLHKEDPAKDTLLATPLELSAGDRIYAPLGVGNHVDHQIVREWAFNLYNTNPDISLYFYEDYPYTRNDQWIQDTLDELEDMHLENHVTAFDTQDLQAKINAIACYHSQISTFWEDTGEMEQSVTQFFTDNVDKRPNENYWKYTRK